MASSKLFVCLVLAALVGCAFAQYLKPISGYNTPTGFVDLHSGQFSSSITGNVYNLARPAVVAAPAYVAPAIATHAYAAPAYAAPAVAAAPVAWIRK